MLKRYADFSLGDDVGNAIALYCPEEFGDLRPQIEAIFASIDVRPGFPDAVLEMNDVFVFAGRTRRCLYDREGRRIEASCLLRERGGANILWHADEDVEIPTDYVTIKEPLVYQSMYFDHWGHFLLESVSRLWAHQANPELRAFGNFFLPYWYDGEHPANVTAFLDGLSEVPLAFRRLSAAAKIETCLIPRASFSELIQGYRGHLAAIHDVAARSLRARKPMRSDQPVYLSRSRLTASDVKRRIDNEREFEEGLARHGFRIVHPELMSLAEQIVLFNQHQVFAGCWGSALHNILFALNGEALTTHVLCEGLATKNFLIVDAMVGNQANYLRVLRPSREQGEPGQPPAWSIDIEMTTLHFRQAGLI